MKYRIKLVLIISVLILSMTGCAESKLKEFQECVDNFCDNYDSFVIKDDPLYKDIGLKGCVIDLSKMADLYEDSGYQKSLQRLY